MTYPDDSIQSLISGDWWESHTSTPQQLAMGQLLWAYVPIHGPLPMMLTPKGRVTDKDHSQANLEATELRIDDSLPKLSGLPVAGLPVAGAEVRLGYKAKRRPVIVASHVWPLLSADLRHQGNPNVKSATRTPVISIVPCYGADQSSTRAGFPAPFVEAIRRGQFPQYMWDQLPLQGSEQSIIRFDQLQPLSRDVKAFKQTGYCLSEQAKAVFLSWLRWFIAGDIQPQDEDLLLFIEDSQSKP